MDKEAQEKIADGLPKNPYPNQYITDIGLTTYQIDKEVETGRIAYMKAQQDMIKAGYCKLPKDNIVLDKDLAEQVFAQICGIRMQNPTSYRSQLDDSYDRLKSILRPKGS